MRLEPLCEMELAYRNSTFGEKFVLARPYEGEEGSGYGEGDGTVRGEKIRGTVRWVNHPHRRTDGSMLPDAHGIIKTEDGAFILFTLQGRTVFVEGKGRQLLSAMFESEDRRYNWLNNTFSILEGEIDPETATMRARVYTCVSNLL